MWVCESVIIKCNDIIQSEASPETHIWCGQGSPFVDFVPGVHTAALDANKKRSTVTLNDPKAKAPYDAAPYTRDRLRDFIDWKRNPDKGNLPDYDAHIGGIWPTNDHLLGHKDILWGAFAGENLPMNFFKNETDIRTAYCNVWTRNTGNFTGPNSSAAADYPSSNQDMVKMNSLPAKSSFQSIRAPWIKINPEPRFLPVENSKGLVCLDDPFNFDLWIATSSVGMQKELKSDKTFWSPAKLQIESLWHLMQVGWKGLAPVLQQLFFLFLKRVKFDIPVQPRAYGYSTKNAQGESSWLEGWDGDMSRAPMLQRISPMAAEACLQILKEKDFDIYDFIMFMKPNSDIPIIGHCDDYLAANHPYMKLLTPSERGREMMYQMKILREGWDSLDKNEKKVEWWNQYW